MCQGNTCVSSAYFSNPLIMNICLAYQHRKPLWLSSIFNYVKPSYPLQDSYLRNGLLAYIHGCFLNSLY